MSNNLFGRIATINIAPPTGGIGKAFSYPPFGIEFDQKMQVGMPGTASIRLINPNDDTVKLTSPSVSKNVTKGCIVTIDAGYKNLHGTCLVGQAHNRSIKREGANVILQMDVSDSTYLWLNRTISQTYSNQAYSSILKQLFTAAGLSPAGINVGSDSTPPKFTAKGSFSHVINKICTATASTFYFKNGMLYVDPVDPKDARTEQYLSPSTGLIGNPEAATVMGELGVKFQTLFFYNFNAHDIVMLDSKDYDEANVRIRIITKKFSTIGQCFCEVEGTFVK